MNSVPGTERAHAGAFTQIDTAARLALIAVTEEQDQESAGCNPLCINPDGESCEFGPGGCR